MTHPIDLLLDYQIAARHYPGAVVHIERDGKTLYKRAAGRMHGADDAPPMRSDALFRVASLTKPVVSVVALMLAEEGRIGLDAPAHDHLPELAGWRLPSGAKPARPVTVRDLLRHTAGTPYITEQRDPQLRERMAAVDLDGKMAGMSSDAFIAAVASLPLAQEPGTAFRYGFATDILGVLVERVLGCRLGEALRARVFAPLGMRDTGFEVGAADAPRLPSAFAEDKGWFRFTGNFADAQAAGTLLHAGGAGLVTTIDDYVRFARMLVHGGELDGTRYLKPETFAEMTTDQLGPAIDGPYGFTGPGFGFGLGLAVRLKWGVAPVPCRPGELTWSGATGMALYLQPAERWFAIAFTCNMASRLIARMEFRRAAASA